MKGRRLPLGSAKRERAASDDEKTHGASGNGRVANLESPPDQPASPPVSLPSSTRDAPSAPREAGESDVVSDSEDHSVRDSGKSGTKSTIPSKDEPSSEKESSKEGSTNGSPNHKSAEEKETTPLRKKLNFQGTGPGTDPPHPLIAVEKDGRHSTVKVIVDGQSFNPSSEGKMRFPVEGGALPLGQDGNQYYCQVCGEFGNVVCCDGCPRVYHQSCIPIGDTSRKSLDNDDDPWFCPNCIIDTKGSRRQSRRSVEKGDRRSSKQRCVDCHSKRSDLSLEPCGECGNYVHYPPCIEDENPGTDRVLCSTCRAVDALTKEEDDLHETTERSLAAKNLESEGSDDADEGGVGAASRHNSDEDGIIQDEDGGIAAKVARPKRKRSASVSSATEKKSKKKLKKKKNKRKRARADSIEEVTPSLQVAETHQVTETDPYTSRRKTLGLAQATPAFCFYLAENRWKIERVLARKHRYFNRLPKGDDRNELVAREAALWWVKLRPTDHRRYMNLSMRDFEHRITEWKEEKNIRDMTQDEDDVPEDADEFVNETSEIALADDDRLTVERHERLYLGTSVGSKPFKPEPDESYNRVLLDLLHDMRFHPLPMLNSTRTDADLVIEEHNSKITIPYFDVHGPISTSVGDECLGCSRGWTHFCPVLQRRIPAIEHRAKLQPPLSSLMATRIGLGLRPKLERIETPEQTENEDVKHLDMFSWHETQEIKELKNLPVVPSSSIIEPSERADDIVQFIEEAMAMKVPEPPAPNPPEANRSPVAAKTSVGRSLPTQKQKEEPDDDAEGMRKSDLNKCGRCRTIIQNDTGCVQCRRAQLVINMSKRQPAGGSSGGAGRQPKGEVESDSKLLKAHTAMLGRVQMKEGSGEIQSPGDQAVSNAIMKMRWTPSAILPPQKCSAPSKRQKIDSDDSEDSDEEDSQQSPSEAEVVDVVLDQDPTKEDEVASPPKEELDQDEEQDPEGSSGKRPRSKRLKAAANNSGVKEAWAPADRQKVAEEHQKEVNELQKRTTSIACCGLLLGLMRRDPLLLFAEPVAAEGYSAIVKNPIDFGIIRSNVLGGKYQSLGAFMLDARLLCENALVYNPPGSIYSKTAEELYEVLGVMQKRASHWMSAIRDAHASFMLRAEAQKRKVVGSNEVEEGTTPIEEDDPFAELRKKWPEAVERLEDGDWLRSQVEADFMRTKENETAYYGSLAVRRVAAAAAASLAPYTDSGGIHSVVSKRNHLEDAGLRRAVDDSVAQLIHPVQLKDVTSWREESVIRFMRKVQSRRMERRIVSGNGCARCDGISVDQEMKVTMNGDAGHWGKTKKKGESDLPRVDGSRMELTTGVASAHTREKIERREDITYEVAYSTVHEVCVSVRGSKIHGWGLYADQPFNKGDVVAEYIGEYVTNPVADVREKVYQEQRIQDYQFRLDDKLVIDATMKGGHGRYINHNCSPSCYAKIIPAPDKHLKRVIIIAQRDIEINEEITYDYQFPLELNLAARIPCNCQSEMCRGFMNWDLPEKGSNNRALLVQKRGANMRDRIRRLGRPLKRDET
jgi:hypothetical protein